MAITFTEVWSRLVEMTNDAGKRMSFISYQ